jgi:hypothetical protein
MTILLPSPRLQGWFKIEATKLDGSKRLLADWFPNLVTDAGLNRIGTGSYLTSCHVGTSNTAPTVTDTTVGGFLAASSSRFSDTNGAQSSAPYYGWRQITYRFALGAVVGNVASVAIATSNTNGGSTILFSRALVLDEFGDPTTVTVLADEILDVTYQLRLYPPLTDVVRDGVTIAGSGTHDTITRARSVTSSSWSAWLGSVATISPASPSPIAVYNGDIGAITGSPSGSSGSANPSNAAYGNNNLYRDGSVSYGLTQGNVSGGIRSASWTTSIGLYQTRFDPVIAKNSSKTLSLSFRYHWDRYTP